MTFVCLLYGYILLYFVIRLLHYSFMIHEKAFFNWARLFI